MAFIAGSESILMHQTEREITAAIRNLLKTLGIFHFKQMQGLGSTPGCPDILAIIPSHIDKKKTGCFLGIEVKTEKGRLSEHQKRFLDRINEEGGIAFVARSPDDVIEALGVNDRFLF